MTLSTHATSCELIQVCLCLPAVSKAASLSPEDGLSCIRNMARPIHLPDLTIQKAFLEAEHGQSLLFGTIVCC